MTNRIAIRQLKIIEEIERIERQKKESLRERIELNWKEDVGF